MTGRPSDLEIAQAICCGEHCCTETTHCHASDHFGAARRVRELLDGCQAATRDAALPDNAQRRVMRLEQRIT
jgi:hypothetical protein